ncbi:MAG TPA: hypothetical protein VFS11_03200 [Gemmatimonadales bacterium]|nr:hypothetical protein [Gemmatimonadales bacterium]
MPTTKPATLSLHDDESLWTPKRTAKYLCMSERWLRASTVPKAVLPGRRTPGKRPRRTVRYVPSEVRAWVERQLTSRVRRAA